ncbi:lipid A biosynthesis protein [Croceitalea sp. MTPC9]|uniref:lysophospholipid acyltransferase family protein n=1 Tax=unclassified Croceitalea TaxID=2632280 RepID=UPI002B382A53|nr:lipid A biosynthesis protein [Croceitalea sp. MTPC6]GMN15651.1 lipid A biosynthesis protein [Croceitalea sp. MTPC9]
MQLVVYLITYPILWVFSRLPFKLIHFISDCVFYLLYYVISYRKKVVYNNLKLVFPNKSEEEILQIQRKFYKHMCDVFLEMTKTMGMSKKEVKKRYHLPNIEVLQEIVKSKTVLIVCSHYANWEWNTSINNYIDARGYGVYQRIANPYFDKLTRKVRNRWDTNLITQQETVKTVIGNEKKNTISVYGMVSDQSPMVKKGQYWSDFMGVKVPVYKGAEQLARKLDLAVVFLKVSKVKRGYYKAELIPITLDGANTSENEITEQFLRLAEQQIHEAPEFYLWTHRRWKHRDKVPTEYLNKDAL